MARRLLDSSNESVTISGGDINANVHDGSGNPVDSTVNGSRGLDVHIITDTIEKAIGTAIGSLVLLMGGSDGTNARAIRTDTDGHTQSDILSTVGLTDTELRATAVPVSNAALPLPTGAATSALQLPDSHNVQQVERPLNMEYEDGATAYQGWAEPGTATSGNTWRIRRIVTTGADVSITWADGDSSFDNQWDGRAGLSYS